MKCLLLLVISFSAWLAVSEADPCSHLPGYSNHGRSCYKLYTVKKTWAVAEASCVADGGHLASIHSSEEQKFLAELVGGSSNIWIGIIGVPPNMTWSDNTSMDYDGWAAGEPNRLAPVTACGRIRANPTIRWTDSSCTVTLAYICRADSVQNRVCFQKIPGGVSVDPTVIPASVQIVRSTFECARRCKQDDQCVHFMIVKEGKYFCETYTSWARPLTAAPPLDNYAKIGC